MNRVVFLAAALMCAACGANKDGGTEDLENEGADASTGGDDGGTVFDIGQGTTTVDGAFIGDAACAKTEAAAIKPPVDIIFAIDQSGSMGDDIANVKSNINSLSTELNKTGLNYRVIMIAGYNTSSVDGDGNPRSTSSTYQVCVPSPLGGATCGASSSRFRQSNINVQSWDALKIIAQSYDSTASGVVWKDFLRTGAAKVIIPITDDNSVAGTGTYYGISATDFDTRMLSKPGYPFGTKSKRNYVVYPIMGAPAYPAETPKCGTNAVNEGPEYVALAKLTKGKWFPICLTNFAPVFTEMAKTIATRVACELVIPAPPTGEKLDPAKVNVTYTPSGGGSATVVKKDDSLPCEGGANGWQYNSDNTKILLCGDACKTVQADLGAKVTVEFGCGTITR